MNMFEYVSNIVSIVTSATLLIGIIELLKETRAQKWESFFHLHEYLSQEQFADARKLVRTELYRKEYALWTEEDKKSANRVCASYDQAGIMLGAGLLNKKTKKEFLKSSWGQSIIDQYNVLLPFLEDQQTPTKTGLDFFKHFVWLYEETKRMRGEDL